MIAFTMEQLNGWLAQFLWPFVRILALVGAAPLFSESTIPTRVKIGLAFMLTIAVAPAIGPMPAVPPSSYAGLFLLSQQVLIGIALGLSMRVVFAAVQTAGEFVGLQMGLSFASFFDPATGANTAVLSRLFNIVAMLVFLALDGHLLVLGALVRIGGFGGLDLLVAGLDAHRRIGDHLAILIDGRGVGQHPVETAVLAAVLHHPQPGLPGLQGAPQVLVRLGRHVGMPYQVVRLADQFVALEAADLDEGGVRVDDPPLGVGARDQVLVLAQLGLYVIYREVNAHCQSPVELLNYTSRTCGPPARPLPVKRRSGAALAAADRRFPVLADGWPGPRPPGRGARARVRTARPGAPRSRTIGAPALRSLRRY
ncbi:flagellar biosynthetic protein [Bordetella pertussis]|nr:flagellar biosynthetic protein [Bordetella pertussis]